MKNYFALAVRQIHGLPSCLLGHPVTQSPSHPVTIFFIFSLLLFNSPQAQTRIVGDVAVTQMVERHVELNSRVKTIPGYRVQIASFSGVNAKTSSFNLRDQFMTDYPLTQAYIVFDEPNFKVKVGDFRTRLEAYAFLQEIKEVYKGYIIRDNIYPEPPVQEELAPDDQEIEN